MKGGEREGNQYKWKMRKEKKFWENMSSVCTAHTLYNTHHNIT